MSSPLEASGIPTDWQKVSPVESMQDATVDLDGLVLAAGFEERALGVLPNWKAKSGARCILIRFQNSIPGNEQIFGQYLTLAQDKFGTDAVTIVDLSQDHPARFERDLLSTLGDLPSGNRRFALDVSGLPAYAMCMALKALRAYHSQDELVVFYTSAIDYNPSYEQYRDLIKESTEEIELIPHSMALEMGENLLLDPFSGYRSQNAKSCLAILAGYEAHRSNGVVEAVNPALLLLLYGKPGDERLQWRQDLSQRLHRKFERSRRTATEVVSTLKYQEALNALEEYYNFLIDDYDLVVAPIGSKMHTLAAFLFWERFGEVQLLFPMPIGYDPCHRPIGIGTTYSTTLAPRALLFRGSSDAVPQSELLARRLP